MRLFRLQRLRAHGQAIALVLLAALSSGPLVVPHTDPLGDAACSPSLASTDASAERLNAVPSHDEAAQHCFICHLARSFSCLLRAAGPLVQTALAAEPLHLAPERAARGFDWTLVPGRAPPA